MNGNPRVRVRCSFCGEHAWVREVETLNFCGRKCAEGFRENMRRVEELGK